MFYVVHFTDDDTVEYVPEEWIVGKNQCRWPKCSPSMFRMLRKKKEVPSHEWQYHEIRVLAIVENEEKAVEKVRLAEDTSDLNTDNDGKLKRRKEPVQRFMHEDLSQNISYKIDRIRTGAPSLPNLTSTPESSFSQVYSSPTDECRGTVKYRGACFARESTNVPFELNNSSREGTTKYVTVPENFILTILNQLHSLESKIDGLSREVNRLRKSNVQPDVGIKFSQLETIEDLLNAQSELREMTYRQSMVSWLSLRGGESCSAAVRCIMKKLLANQLMRQCVRVRTNNDSKKVSLGLINDVIQDAVRTNPGMKVIPNDEIDKQITKCLAGSVDRDGGREERRRKKLIFVKLSTENLKHTLLERTPRFTGKRHVFDAFTCRLPVKRSTLRLSSRQRGFVRVTEPSMTCQVMNVRVSKRV